MSGAEPSRALVTGGDSGIGRAVAVALARAGFEVGITWHTDQDGARETARRIRGLGRSAVVGRLDLGAGSDVQPMIRSLVDRLGGVDVLVNNAALNHRAAVLDEGLEAWRRVLDVNLTGSFLCAQAVARWMVQAGRGGRIVNITSVHESMPLRFGAAYAASKAGLGLLTKVMAMELADHGITVNAVAPGHIATPMNGYGDDAESLPELAGVPLRRPGTPEEIAAMVVHLTSPGAAFTTGSSILVDGGLQLMAVSRLQEEVEAR